MIAANWKPFEGNVKLKQNIDRRRKGISISSNSFEDLEITMLLKNSLLEEIHQRRTSTNG